MFKFFLLLVECKHENTPFIFTHIRKHNGISWDVLSQPPYLKKKSPMFLMFYSKNLNCNTSKYKCLSKELNFLLSLLPKVNDLLVGLNDLIQQIFNECLLVSGIVLVREELVGWQSREREISGFPRR